MFREVHTNGSNADISRLGKNGGTLSQCNHELRASVAATKIKVLLARSLTFTRKPERVFLSPSYRAGRNSGP